MKRRYFNSKILLFGEYTVLVDGTALGIPFKAYYAQWKFDGCRTKDKSLNGFYKYLLSTFPKTFDASNFDNEILNGLRLDASIPIGKGLGSSAALTAAVYDRYFFNPSEDLNVLQSTFSKMEAYFHGTSSGFDPLIIYLDSAIKRSNHGVQMIEKDLKCNFNCFLFDSKIPRQAHQLIPLFKSKLKEANFTAVIKELKSLNEVCINGIFDEFDIFESIKLISMLQFKYFKEMIPESVASYWQKGMDTEQYYMKLCGAGGGGYFLLFTTSDFQASDSIKIF